MENLQLKKIKWPIIIAGPCVIEDEYLLNIIAEELKKIEVKYKITVVFKSSFDKANRTSINSYRGPGLNKGLKMLQYIKKNYELPILTDVHETYQVKPVAEVVDIIQIPAFLCRQTDLLLQVGHTGKIVNIKKAQFLSGKDMKYPAEKVRSTGNEQILLTERGNIYGYNNLAVDFRNISDMKDLGYKTIMDCTHSVQRPGGNEGITSGDRRFVVCMAKAAKAFDVDGYFLETHPYPDNALSDAANMLELQKLKDLIPQLIN